MQASNLTLLPAPRLTPTESPLHATLAPRPIRYGGYVIPGGLRPGHGQPPPALPRL